MKVARRTQGAMDDILKGKTLLVVDDTALARLLISETFGRSGALLLESPSAEAALQLAQEQAIDAFLLDVRLPDMNGIELCRALRALDRYRVAPIVFVTSIDEREILQWALEAGADDFIQKPVHGMVLRRRLANLLQRAAYVKQVESLSAALAVGKSEGARQLAAEVEAALRRLMLEYPAPVLAENLLVQRAVEAIAAVREAIELREAS
jgi:DNA-binding response OmpR family regulator